MQVWPSGWRWVPNQTDYEQMILGVYAAISAFDGIRERGYRAADERVVLFPASR